MRRGPYLKMGPGVKSSKWSLDTGIAASQRIAVLDSAPRAVNRPCTAIDRNGLLFIQAVLAEADSSRQAQFRHALPFRGVNCGSSTGQSFPPGGSIFMM